MEERLTLEQIKDQLDYQILMTPTGELRNELTQANIHLQLAIYKRDEKPPLSRRRSRLV